MDKRLTIVAIVGPTGSGKSDMSVVLAKKIKDGNQGRAVLSAQAVACSSSELADPASTEKANQSMRQMLPSRESSGYMRISTYLGRLWGYHTQPYDLLAQK